MQNAASFEALHAERILQLMCPLKEEKLEGVRRFEDARCIGLIKPPETGFLLSWQCLLPTPCAGCPDNTSLGS